MRPEHDATLFDTLAPFLIFLFLLFVFARIGRRGGGKVVFIPMGMGGGFPRGGGFSNGGGGFGGGGGFFGGGGSSGGGAASGG
jgi:uncharacterized protein